MAQYEITLQCDVPHYLTLTVTAANREAAEALAIEGAEINDNWETSYHAGDVYVTECRAVAPTTLVAAGEG